MKWKYLVGDALEVLSSIPTRSIQCIVTSPPYWGLRDYKIPNSTWDDGWVGCLGNEPDPDQYAEHLIEIFNQARNTLKEDATIWLNIGDSYYNDELVGIPWLVAFLFRKNGYRIVKDIIWHKPNPPPQNTTSRPVSAHEHIFLISISKNHFYNPDGFRIPHSRAYIERAKYPMGYNKNKDENFKTSMRSPNPNGRLVRDVWSFITAGDREIHPAVFPDELPKRCILLGSNEGDTILDPFAGSGTTIRAARNLKRNAIGIDISSTYHNRANDKAMLNVPDIETFAE